MSNAESADFLEEMLTSDCVQILEQLPHREHKNTPFRRNQIRG